jgi:hypothetical protein
VAPDAPLRDLARSSLGQPGGAGNPSGQRRVGTTCIGDSRSRRTSYYGGAYGYIGPYGYAGPYGYVSPYQGYAYVPGYRGRRAWDYPLGNDNTGRPYFRDELGWRPGPPSGNPCWEGQRQQNLC